MSKKIPDADETISMIQEFFRHAEEGMTPLFERCEKGQDFVRGKQWDELVKQELAAQGKKALTINHCLPISNFLAGTQRQNRKDVRILARRGGNSAVAKVRTGLNKHAEDLAGADHEKSECFKDGVDGAIGWLWIEESYEQDPFNGDMLISKQSPYEVFYDLARTAS